MDSGFEPTPVLSHPLMIGLFPVNVIIKCTRQFTHIVDVITLMIAFIIIVDAFKRSIVGFEVKHPKVCFGPTATLTFVQDV